MNNQLFAVYKGNIRPFFRPFCLRGQRPNLSMDEFYIVNNIYVNKSESGRIQERAKPFASVEERKKQGAKTTLYTVYT